ncbi:unnamed protein product [Lathyrus oleraceus]
MLTHFNIYSFCKTEKEERLFNYSPSSFPTVIFQTHHHKIVGGASFHHSIVELAAKTTLHYTTLSPSPTSIAGYAASTPAATSPRCFPSSDHHNNRFTLIINVNTPCYHLQTHPQQHAQPTASTPPRFIGEIGSDDITTTSSLTVINSFDCV